MVSWSQGPPYQLIVERFRKLLVRLVAHVTLHHHHLGVVAQVEIESKV